MLILSFLGLAAALVAGLLGFGGTSGETAGLLQTLFFVFLSASGAIMLVGYTVKGRQDDRR